MNKLILMSDIKSRLKNILESSQHDVKSEKKISNSMYQESRHVPKLQSSSKSAEDIITKIQNFKDLKKEMHSEDVLNFEISREALNKFKKPQEEKTPEIPVINNIVNGLNTKIDNNSSSSIKPIIKDTQNSSTIINYNDNSKSNNTIIKKLTLNFLNNNSTTSALNCNVISPQEKIINKGDFSNYIDQMPSLRNSMPTTAKVNQSCVAKNNFLTGHKAGDIKTNSNNNQYIRLKYNMSSENTRDAANFNSRPYHKKTNSIKIEMPNSEIEKASIIASAPDGSGCKNKIKNQINSFVKQLIRESPTQHIKEKSHMINYKHLSKTVDNTKHNEPKRMNYSNLQQDAKNNLKIHGLDSLISSDESRGNKTDRLGCSETGKRNQGKEKISIGNNMNKSPEEKEDETEMHILTFSRATEAKYEQIDLNVKVEDLRVLKNQIIVMNEDMISRLDDEYIQELKELARTIKKVFG